MGWVVNKLVLSVFGTAQGARWAPPGAAVCVPTARSFNQPTRRHQNKYLPNCVPQRLTEPQHCSQVELRFCVSRECLKVAMFCLDSVIYKGTIAKNFALRVMNGRIKLM